jgi:hypothetical protein
MTVVNATLCLPFQQIQEVIHTWEQSVGEACTRTGFPYEAELAEVLAVLTAVLPPLLYTRLLTSVSIDFGHAEVLYTLRYDATPQDQDELALEILDLLSDEPPEGCVITVTLADLERAAFLNCLDIDRYATAHVSLLLDALPEATEEGDI